MIFANKDEHYALKRHFAPLLTPQFATRDAAFFAINTPSGKADAETRSRIRSHVQKQLQSQRRKQSAKMTLRSCRPSRKNTLFNENLRPHGLSPDYDQDCDQAQYGRWKETGYGGCDDRNMAELLSNPQNDIASSTLLDPFDQAAAPIDQTIHRLLYYYVMVFYSNGTPHIYDKGYASSKAARHKMKTTMSDPVLLYAACSLAGSVQLHELSSESMSRETQDLLQQKKEANACTERAMQLLRTRLNNTKDALLPSTIMAVAQLGMSAAFGGNTAAFLAHYKGFVQMIALRGGIDTFTREDAYILSRNDCTHAWSFQMRPYFPIYKSIARTRYNHHPSRFIDTELGSFLGDNLRAVADDLNTLTFSLQACRNGTRLDLDSIEYLEDTFAAALHALADFPYPQDMTQATSQAPSIYYLQHAWRVAAYIYFDAFIRYGPDKRLKSSCVSYRLIDTLRDNEDRMDWTLCQNIHLWILFVGFAAARDAEQRLWFTRQTGDAVRIMRLRTREEMRNVLKRQIWRGDVLEGPLRDLGNAISLN